MLEHVAEACVGRRVYAQADPPTHHEVAKAGATKEERDADQHSHDGEQDLLHVTQLIARVEQRGRLTKEGVLAGELQGEGGGGKEDVGHTGCRGKAVLTRCKEGVQIG